MSKEGGELRDVDIAKELDVSIATSGRTRSALCEQGLEVAVRRNLSAGREDRAGAGQPQHARARLAP